MHTDCYDIVIAGAGPAGLSAAQMLGRARRRVLVIDSATPRNRFAEHMHGVVGFDGASPWELRRRGQAEAEAYGVEFRSGLVDRVDDIDGGLDVRYTTDDRTGTVRITTRGVILATGIIDRLPAIAGLAEGWGRTVLHCPYCHGWEVRERPIGVLATSPQSLHQIELVRQWSPDVVAFTADMGELSDDVRERLHARGIRLIPSPVVEVADEVLDQGGATIAVVTATGERVELAAIFTGGVLEPLDGMLDPLQLTRADGPVGSFIAVDAAGATSNPRVWAAGNVVTPMANVPLSMGAGSMAGSAANAALVMMDADAAVVARRAHTAEWEQHYRDTDQVWSGAVNETTAAVVEDLERSAALSAGTALDVGCGEGADALWLANRGWTVTGIDLSATAVARATEAASRADVSVTFVTGDIDEVSGELFDLVTSSFFHSWATGFSRIALLRAAARLVAPGGRLLIVSHVGAPPVPADHGHPHPALAAPSEERAQLRLDPAEWTLEREEIRERSSTAGWTADGILLYRRSGRTGGRSRSR